MATVDEIVEFVGEVLEKRFVEIDPNLVERGFFIPFDGFGLRIDIAEQTDDYLKSFAAEMDIPAEVTVKLVLFICREIEPTPEFFEYAALELPNLTDYMPWIFWNSLLSRGPWPLFPLFCRNDSLSDRCIFWICSKLPK